MLWPHTRSWICSLNVSFQLIDESLLNSNTNWLRRGTRKTWRFSYPGQKRRIQNNTHTPPQDLHIRYSNKFQSPAGNLATPTTDVHQSPNYDINVKYVKIFRSVWTSHYDLVRHLGFQIVVFIHKVCGNLCPLIGHENLIYWFRTCPNLSVGLRSEPITTYSTLRVLSIMSSRWRPALRWSLFLPRCHCWPRFKPWGEHANAKPKALRFESTPGPYCCDATRQ